MLIRLDTTHHFDDREYLSYSCTCLPNLQWHKCDHIVIIIALTNCRTFHIGRPATHGHERKRSLYKIWYKLRVSRFRQFRIIAHHERSPRNGFTNWQSDLVVWTSDKSNFHITRNFWSPVVRVTRRSHQYLCLLHAEMLVRCPRNWVTI